MTTETNDATPTPTVTTETPGTRVQPALVTQIFDESTTPTTSLSQDVRTQSRITTQCSWTHQASGLVSSKKKVTRNTHRTCRCRGAYRVSSPLETEVFVDDMLSQMKPHVVCGAMISEPPSCACRSSTGKCVCDLLGYFEPRTVFRSATSPDRWSHPKNREVSMTKLDVDQQKNMRDAMTDDSRDTVVAPPVPRREGCTAYHSSVQNMSCTAFSRTADKPKHHW